MNFRFLSPALEELTEAAEFYDKRVPGLGADFINEVDRAIDLVLEFPEAWGKLSDNHRHCNLRRFPFTVNTVDDRGDIMIVECWNHSGHSHRPWAGGPPAPQ